MTFKLHDVVEYTYRVSGNSCHIKEDRFVNLIKVLTDRNNIMETALRLQYTHEQFYGINYFIKSIQILESINKNPHIPLKHKVSKKSKYGSHYRK
jgi:hypothetical protein